MTKPSMALVVNIVNCGTQLFMCVLEGLAELLKHPLRKLLFPAVSAYNTIELHTESGIDD